MKLIKIIWNYITDNRWVVRRCGFPYDRGYATFNPAKNTVLDTGLSKARAKEICKELNSK